MPRGMKWIGILLLFGCAAVGRAYEVQPYTPEPDTPAEAVVKQTALDALRSEWNGDNESSGTISRILSKHGVSNPASVPGNFSAGGAWYKTLPTGSSLSGSEYDVHREFLFETERGEEGASVSATTTLPVLNVLGRCADCELDGRTDQ